MTNIRGAGASHGAKTGVLPLRVLAIDVGAGTQDVLIYESDKTPENCFKLVLPSQTQVVGQRIRRATTAGRPIHLAGTLMGGGESSNAVVDHLAAGLAVTATPDAAKTIHNDLARVARLGVEIREDASAGAVIVETTDIDLAALGATMGVFGITVPEIVAVAVQDHGYRPGAGNNEVRFEYLQGLIEGGGDVAGMVYREPPPGMTRMAAVASTVPGVYLMDTGAAAVLGALGDPEVAAAVRGPGAILINIGNMHTFAVLVRGRRLYGLFEHHTGGITPTIIGALVDQLRAGTISNDSFRRDFDGHGAALASAYLTDGPFSFVAATGPNRRLAEGLGYHMAVPHGDMMLSGAYGLVEGVTLALAAEGLHPGVTLAAGVGATAP